MHLLQGWSLSLLWFPRVEAEVHLHRRRRLFCKFHFHSDFGFRSIDRSILSSFNENRSQVATKPTGERINVVTQHIQNLQTPSTPYFFNTLYDPYTEGSDFVRGYPFSLRSGVPTAISHGLWLNIPDYDAPTQLVKPLERNTRYVDAVMTIPKGSLFPMCGMNLAFDRELIGPAMYFGLFGEGHPIGRYDDMWAGWCTKVISNLNPNLNPKS